MSAARDIAASLPALPLMGRGRDSLARRDRIPVRSAFASRRHCPRLRNMRVTLRNVAKSNAMSEWEAKPVQRLVYSLAFIAWGAGLTAQAETSADAIAKIARQVCVDPGPGEGMVAAAKTAASAEGWTADSQSPKSSYTSKLFPVNPERKPVEWVTWQWAVPGFGEGGKLEIHIAGKAEFPDLEVDSCTLTIDGAHAKDFAAALGAEMKLGASKPIGGQKDSSFWFLGNPPVGETNIAKLEGGYAILGVNHQRLDPLSLAEAATAAVNKMGAEVSHEPRTVTVVAIVHQHVPKSVADKLGGRIISLFP